MLTAKRGTNANPARWFQQIYARQGRYNEAEMLGESKTGKRTPGAVQAQGDARDAGKGGRRKADAALPDPLAANLRAVFSAVESEPVPDRFRDLLDRLAQDERK
jgi:hypothetical protein